MTRVLYTEHDYPDVNLERGVLEAAGIELELGNCKTDDELIAAGKDADAFLIQYAPITERVIVELPRLGLISRIGAGFDTVDTAACARHGVWVANSPDYGIGEVATHALSLALALIRNVVGFNRDVNAGKWHYLSSGRLRRASEMTLGIVGLGRIGKRMAHISRNTFKRVIACDPYLIDGDFPAYVERADLGALFEASDVVSLHTPLNDETRGMIDERVLRRMRPGSFLVNTARGAVVAIEHLLDALDSGILAGAGLDVLPVEPPAPESRLLGHPKVILTPHVAYFSAQSEIELRRKAAQNIVTWAKTGRPDYVVVTGARHPRA
ncbi:MAG: C-terminal binding protein [Betaproteobacteria bacterium]|nr:MAG: C-terminal binding protein [Betaproteobacteria bacterium]